MFHMQQPCSWERFLVKEMHEINICLPPKYVIESVDINLKRITLWLNHYTTNKNINKTWFYIFLNQLAFSISWKGT